MTLSHPCHLPPFFPSSSPPLSLSFNSFPLLWPSSTHPRCCLSSQPSRAASSYTPPLVVKACDGLPSQRFFATCAPGLEKIVAAELSSPMIGAACVEVGTSGVSFQGSCATGFRANLWLRSAVRVLQELATGSLRRNARDPVYEFARDAADWPRLLTEGWSDFDHTHEGNGAESLSVDLEEREQEPFGRDGVDARAENGAAFRTFEVQSRVWDCGRVSSAKFASNRAKDAICDAIRDACEGRKPKSPKEVGKEADLPLFLSLYKNNAILYRDMSGTSLHKRGYKDVMHKASLNEGVAAAILTIAGWNRWIAGFGEHNKNLSREEADVCNGPVLLDPMCGSGTILIEAALMAANVAPGLLRTSWPFMKWHDFDLEIWKDCQSQAFDARIETPPGLRILGNDSHEGALSLCVRNAKHAGVYHLLDLSCQDCSLYTPPVPPNLVVVNPPWGSRLGDDSLDDTELIAGTWIALGKFLKRTCTTADVYVLSGNGKATRGLQLKSDKKWHLVVGGVDCRLLHYYVLPPKQTEVDILKEVLPS